MSASKHYLIKLVKRQKKGIQAGIFSVCSAHPYVIEAAMEQALEKGKPVLIESTSNQVNQFGGYTGMKPVDFLFFVYSLCCKIGFPEERLILGGDHLGPYPWRKEPAAEAMGKACRMVKDYVQAGFTKIHLDASMHLEDDPGDRQRPLDSELAAERTARLCLAAEQAYGLLKSTRPEASKPVYVIGTEVPVPGGTAEGEEPPRVTGVNDFKETVTATRETFSRLGLEEAWKRVIAVVVQPGIEFGNEQIYPYIREKAKALCGALRSYPLVFEGHSTDYQEASALRQMVEDGIAILKVGPALTFVMREAIFMLSLIEEELLAGDLEAQISELPEVLERVMVARPQHWQAFYCGNERERRLARKYSLSDRCRYYWSDPVLKTALSRLLDNLRKHPTPLTLLSQFFPAQYWKVRRGKIPSDPEVLIKDRIKEVLETYSHAIQAVP